MSEEVSLSTARNGHTIYYYGNTLSNWTLQK